MLKNKRIGYYIGSFDPPHRGHEHFAQGVLNEGICDYVLFMPAWGADSYKERTSISIRLEMLYAIFSQDPRIIVTKLSPWEMQQKLTRIVVGQSIKGYPLVKLILEGTKFLGLIGSDVALGLALPASSEKEEADRLKKEQVFMRGISIPEKYRESTIGGVMALPVLEFVVGLRESDDLSPLEGAVLDRPICFVYRDKNGSNASSTLIKRRLKQGESVDDLLDYKVIAIIKEHYLYTFL